MAQRNAQCPQWAWTSTAPHPSPTPATQSPGFGYLIKSSSSTSCLPTQHGGFQSPGQALISATSRRASARPCRRIHRRREPSRGARRGVWHTAGTEGGLGLWATSSPNSKIEFILELRHRTEEPEGGGFWSASGMPHHPLAYEGLRSLNSTMSGQKTCVGISGP